MPLRSTWHIAILGTVALAWQLFVYFAPEYAFFIGSPRGIAREFWSLLVEGRLLYHSFVTAYEALVGTVLGTLAGTGAGLSLWLSKRIERLARPYLSALGSIPIFALGPVLIFWFGTGISSKIVLVFLSTFVLAAMQALSGAHEADRTLLRMGLAFGATRRQLFRSIVAPSAVLWVLAGIRLNVGMGLLGAFIGEFISSRAGLGHLIIVAEGLYNVNQIWVGILCIVAIAMLFLAATRPLESWANRWTY